MCARWPTIAMSKLFFRFERSFCRCMAVMSCALGWCVCDLTCFQVMWLVVRWFVVLLQRTTLYSVLQSTTPVLLCTTKYYSSTTLYYKVLRQYYSSTTKYYASTTMYYSVLQSTTPVLLCTITYYSSTTLYYKELRQYYNVLLQYYSVLQSTTPVLQRTTPVLLCTLYYKVLQSTTPVLLRYYSVLQFSKWISRALVEQPMKAYSTPALPAARICHRSWPSTFPFSSFFVTMEEEIQSRKRMEEKIRPSPDRMR